MPFAICHLAFGLFKKQQGQGPLSGGWRVEGTATKLHSEIQHKLKLTAKFELKSQVNV
jgi:hypothetical protein